MISYIPAVVHKTVCDVKSMTGVEPLNNTCLVHTTKQDVQTSNGCKYTTEKISVGNIHTLHSGLLNLQTCLSGYSWAHHNSWATHEPIMTHELLMSYSWAHHDSWATHELLMSYSWAHHDSWATHEPIMTESSYNHPAKLCKTTCKTVHITCVAVSPCCSWNKSAHNNNNDNLLQVVINKHVLYSNGLLLLTIQLVRHLDWQIHACMRYDCMADGASCCDTSRPQLLAAQPSSTAS
jgi:hypothetical protein